MGMANQSPKTIEVVRFLAQIAVAQETFWGIGNLEATRAEATKRGFVFEDLDSGFQVTKKGMNFLMKEGVFCE